jgi:hypothetical protein
VERREEDLRNDIFSWIWYLFLVLGKTKFHHNFISTFLSIDSFLSVLS